MKENVEMGMETNKTETESHTLRQDRVYTNESISPINKWNMK